MGWPCRFVTFLYGSGSTPLSHGISSGTDASPATQPNLLYVHELNNTHGLLSFSTVLRIRDILVRIRIRDILVRIRDSVLRDIVWNWRITCHTINMFGARIQQHSWGDILARIQIQIRPYVPRYIVWNWRINCHNNNMLGARIQQHSWVVGLLYSVVDLWHSGTDPDPRFCPTGHCLKLTLHMPHKQSVIGARIQQHSWIDGLIYSVADQWHFGPDPDPCLWITDPDPAPDHAIFVIDLQDANRKPFFVRHKIYEILSTSLVSHTFKKIFFYLTKAVNVAAKLWFLPTNFSERTVNCWNYWQNNGNREWKTFSNSVFSSSQRYLAPRQV